MKPDKLTIHDLFQRERRYVVPLYQRAYVWNEEGQWEPLWEDIERQAEACLESEGLVAKRSHFLGAIVLNVSKIVGSGVARSEVIDGQQRLTTLQIFITALRDFAAKSGSHHVAKLRRLTVNEDEKAGSDGSYKVWPTNADRALFKTVLSTGAPDALLKALGVTAGKVPRLAGAYLYFSRQIANFVGTDVDEDTRDSRILALLQALRTSLQLVVIELEDGDDPQVIFETLNARGQPLLPSDLIRNYIFLHASNDAHCDADGLYDGYWRPFDDDRVDTAVSGETRFWHIEERQGRLKRPRIDLFLFHYLVMQTEHDLNIGQLFSAFRDWRAETAGPVEALLIDLKFHSANFRKLIEPEGEDRVALLARRLKSLDNSTVYPLLLYVMGLSGERLSTTDRDRIFEDVESWLVRRFVCQLTNKSYNRFFVALLAKMKRAEAGVNLADLVRTELSRSKEVTARWPTDREFLAAWLSKPLYAKSRPDRSVMVLRAIERQIRTNRNEKVTLPDQLSVEHLLPQKGLLSDYPMPTDLPLAEGETVERRRERLMHTVGNLTLLTNELNASASNGTWPTKTKKIALDSDLRLNAWLRADTPATWSEADVVARGRELFEFARLIWFRPTSTGDDDESGEAEEIDAAEKGVWKFTDAELLHAKREVITKALAQREAVELRSDGVARRRSANGDVRAVLSLSKLYEDRPDFPYWYAYHVDQDEYLAPASRGFFVLGCMDRDEAFAVPLGVMRNVVGSLNTTTREDGRAHHHIHLAEREGALALLLPKASTHLDVSAYRLDLKGLAGG